MDLPLPSVTVRSAAKRDKSLRQFYLCWFACHLVKPNVYENPNDDSADQYEAEWQRLYDALDEETVAHDETMREYVLKFVCSIGDVSTSDVAATVKQLNIEYPIDETMAAERQHTATMIEVPTSLSNSTQPPTGETELVAEELSVGPSTEHVGQFNEKGAPSSTLSSTATVKPEQVEQIPSRSSSLTKPTYSPGEVQLPSHRGVFDFDTAIRFVPPSHPNSAEPPLMTRERFDPGDGTLNDSRILVWLGRPRAEDCQSLEDDFLAQWQALNQLIPHQNSELVNLFPQGVEAIARFTGMTKHTLAIRLNRGLTRFKFDHKLCLYPYANFEVFSLREWVPFLSPFPHGDACVRYIPCMFLFSSYKSCKLINCTFSHIPAQVNRLRNARDKTVQQARMKGISVEEQAQILMQQENEASQTRDAPALRPSPPTAAASSPLMRFQHPSGPAPPSLPFQPPLPQMHPPPMQQLQPPMHPPPQGWPHQPNMQQLMPPSSSAPSQQQWSNASHILPPQPPQMPSYPPPMSNNMIYMPPPQHHPQVDQQMQFPPPPPAQMHIPQQYSSFQPPLPVMQQPVPPMPSYMQQPPNPIPPHMQPNPYNQQMYPSSSASASGIQSGNEWNPIPPPGAANTGLQMVPTPVQPMTPVSMPHHNIEAEMQALLDACVIAPPASSVIARFETAGAAPMFTLPPYDRLHAKLAQGLFEKYFALTRRRRVQWIGVPFDVSPRQLADSSSIWRVPDANQIWLHLRRLLPNVQAHKATEELVFLNRSLDSKNVVLHFRTEHAARVLVEEILRAHPGMHGLFSWMAKLSDHLDTTLPSLPLQFVPSSGRPKGRASHPPQYHGQQNRDAYGSTPSHHSSSSSSSAPHFDGVPSVRFRPDRSRSRSRSPVDDKSRFSQPIAAANDAYGSHAPAHGVHPSRLPALPQPLTVKFDPDQYLRQQRPAHMDQQSIASAQQPYSAPQYPAQMPPRASAPFVKQEVNPPGDAFDPMRFFQQQRVHFSPSQTPQLHDRR